MEALHRLLIFPELVLLALGVSVVSGVLIGSAGSALFLVLKYRWGR